MLEFLFLMFIEIGKIDLKTKRLSIARAWITDLQNVSFRALLISLFFVLDSRLNDLEASLQQTCMLECFEKKRSFEELVFMNHRLKVMGEEIINDDKWGTGKW